MKAVNENRDSPDSVMGVSKTGSSLAAKGIDALDKKHF